MANAQPPPSPSTAQSTLTITPPSVELRAGDSQAFEARDDHGNVVTDVTWSLSDKHGTLDPKTGMCIAPAWIWWTRRITVHAEQKHGDVVSASGTATIELSTLRTWTRTLGLYWMAAFGALLALLWGGWPYVCPTCRVPDLVVSPPLVSLGPSQSQQFSADADVTWSNTITPSGVYLAPATMEADNVVTVMATSTQDTRRAASAYVQHSRTGGLRLYPPRVTLAPEETFTFVPQFLPVPPALPTPTPTPTPTSSPSPTPSPTPTPTPSPTPTPLPEWPQPTAGSINDKGEYKAPKDPSFAPVVVFVRTRPDGSGRRLIAAAHVIVTGTPGFCGQACGGGSVLLRLILLVGLAGALGGLMHGMSSFVAFVGNGQLKLSWLWWYLLKPFYSALAAIVTFLVFRLGVGTPDLGISTWDCLKLAGFAALVGLFAEQAKLKLADIFEAVFTPREDPRRDKLVPGKAGEAKTAADKTVADKTVADKTTHERTTKEKAAEAEAGEAKTGEPGTGQSEGSTHS